MSLGILTELHGEVRRLLIAGSSMAAGDLRLGALLPQLHKLGESAPVFRRLGEAVEAVTSSAPEETSPRLLELAALVHAVLYTQGAVNAAGELQQIGRNEAAGTAHVPYRRLKPLISALTERGQGRLEAVRTGYAEGAFSDFRTHIPAVAALADGYTEIADFVQKHVIPAVGSAMVPILREQLDLTGGRADGRRLECLYALTGSESRELYLQAVRDGYYEVRIAAIGILANDPQMEPVLIEQSRDGRREIRQAALHALSRLASPAAVDRLYEALQSARDAEIAVEPVRDCPAEELTGRVLAFGRTLLERFEAGEPPEAEIGEAMTAVISSLRDRGGNEAARGFLQEMLSSSAFMKAETGSTQEAAVKILLESGEPGALAFVEALHERWERRHIGAGLRAAVRLLAPAAVYERYAPLLRSMRDGVTKELVQTLYGLTDSLYQRMFHYAMEAGAESQGSSDMMPAAVTEPEVIRAGDTMWDSRWVHDLIRVGEEELVSRFVPAAGDEVVAEYVLRVLDSAKPGRRRDHVSLLLALFRMGREEAPGQLMRVLEEELGGKNVYYVNRELLAAITLLPAAYAPRIREIAGELKYESVQQSVLEAAARLEESGSKRHLNQ